MKLFQPTANTQAYLKLGAYGTEGSGKTRTLVEIAIGLHQYIGSKKPIAFIDTETGSDYVAHLFKKARIDLVVVKTRSLKTAAEAILEAQDEVDILIEDSLTHLYKDLLSSYVKAKRGGGKYIDMRDWGPIKDTWAELFSNPYVNSRLHFLWAARSKSLFEDVNDEETGKFKPVKVGTGARAETESAYEPSLLLEMEKVHLGEGGKYVRRATVIKDRFDVIDSATFDNPIFANVLPHVEMLNIGGEHVGFEESDATEEVFEDDGSAYKRRKRVKVALEEIENGLVSLFPSTSGKEKKSKLAILEVIFGTTSWTAIQSKRLDDLEVGARTIDALKKEVGEQDMVFESEVDLKEKVAELFIECGQAAEAEPKPTSSGNGQPQPVTKAKKAAPKKAVKETK